ncbi:S-adenosyl-L-methionine-dependent methyltransferase ftsjd2 [Echinococcus granulosus]|uniref:Cap-specific mRNA (nucleoside-2'-O-)-methyltransferase 1 n=1 Tax=Echinococcus granulosus TaxID=6210 RepID=W6UK11_ECHGR|nr:S-adenosyl-L-methionine-dependent methyltransferase ftsjd2 [Echinococcus granulosus]EUB61890.1 S-adenosyl-L-methionine-dependent methyltransferase ftsjd2 [Echinococcus granulosus]
MVQGDENRELLMVLIDLTPVWWGTYAHENLIFPSFIECILAFVNCHLTLSPLNEVAIIGVTPEQTEFLWPSLTPLEDLELQSCYYGQYEAFTILGETVRRKVQRLITSCESLACTVSFASAINNALCYYIRRCRELRPTLSLQNDPASSNTNAIVAVEDISSLLTDNFHARILVVRAAEDNSAQYLSLMNAVFTAQKLGVLIDACIIPPTRMSYSADDPLRQSSTTLQESSNSSLFQQAADLTGGIYLRIPRPAGLLQYLLSVFLPRAGLRSQLILPDCGGGAATGVDFRSACFCHRKMVDLSYVCSVCLSIFCAFTPICSTCQTPFKIPIVAADDYHLGSKGWDLMKRMGWIEGKGLGAQGQGRTQPVQAKVPKKRQGLGVASSAAEAATPSLCFRVLEVSEVPMGPHAWSEDPEIPPPSADDDRVYPWSRWSNFSDAAELPAAALKALQTVLLQPDSPQALGPPIERMDTQTRYCSEELLIEMLFYKVGWLADRSTSRSWSSNSLDKRGRDAITSARIRSNPYENVRSGIFMNRAAMKMANMDALFNGLFSQAAPPNEILHFADICAGPGGFSEYLTWRRGHPFNSTSPTHHFPHIRGYGMTLTGPCDFKMEKFVAGPAETFHPFYGSAKDGDITKWENLASFAQFVAHNTGDKGVHGFDVSDAYNLQEVKSKHIYLCQCLCALTLLRPGGCFVTKLFDIFTDFSVDLIWLMSHVFKRIKLIKPISSRPANSERYLLCEGLITSNPGMAGCPKAPPSCSTANSSSVNSAPQCSKAPFKKSISQRANAVKRSGGNSDVSGSTLQVDTASAVGVLIKHLLAVSEGLHKRRKAEKGEEETSLLFDILRLAHYEEKTGPSEGFADFITSVNEELASHQCLYLSKMIIFADNGAKEDDSRDDLRVACLKKWQIPEVARGPCSWPLWSSNIPPILKSIIRESSKGTMLNNLPRNLCRPTNITLLTKDDLSRSSFSPHSLYAVVLSELLLNSSNLPKQPVMVISLGGGSAQGKENLKYSCDGKKWSDISWPEEIHPRLPAGSLVWALVINTYSPDRLRKHALMLLDAAFIYGIDIQSLSYGERMRHIRDLCNTVDFVNDSVKIISPPLLLLPQMQAFMQQLTLLPCKDAPNKVPMFVATTDGCTCAPKGLLLVKHLASPWSMRRSRGTGFLYYFNEQTCESVYAAPPGVELPFSQTLFLRVPWRAEHDGELDAPYLIEHCHRTQL